MDLGKLYKMFADEFQWFLAAPDRRQYIGERTGVYYDRFVLPLNVPGPDAIVDPIMRAGAVMTARALYDVALKRLGDAEQDIDPTAAVFATWPAPPEHATSSILEPEPVTIEPPEPVDGGETCD